MICKSCGRANELGARFCKSCGAPLESDESMQQNNTYQSENVYQQNNHLGTTAFGSFGGNRDSADTSFEDVAGFQASQGFEINFQGTERRQRRY